MNWIEFKVGTYIQNISLSNERLQNLVKIHTDNFKWVLEFKNGDVMEFGYEKDT